MLRLRFFIRLKPLSKRIYLPAKRPSDMAVYKNAATKPLISKPNETITLSPTQGLEITLLKRAISSCLPLEELLQSPRSH